MRPQGAGVDQLLHLTRSIGRLPFSFTKMTVAHKILLRKLVRSPWEAEDPPTLTHLIPCDQTSCAIATTRAIFLTHTLDIGALEACMRLVLEDLPFLAGR